jgi:glutamyl-Q tRNA(Asp) synthetase
MVRDKHSEIRQGPTGRFAPSPTGELHFGSLVAAVGSYLDIRSRGGRWLVRIEDLDPPREVAGAAERQIATLDHFGLVPDAPPVFQSQSHKLHETALKQLLDHGRAFPCACSRKQLPASGIYPGTCRHGLPPGKQAKSVRFRTDEQIVEFNDRLFGPQRQSPSTQSGDFIIRRGDGLIAYQLAVVVDDAASGVTDVVRGADLLDSTGRQILLQQALGLPTPTYLHLPLVVDANGRKLSKSDDDDPVASMNPVDALRLCLAVLGHQPPEVLMTIDALWHWALRNWNADRIPSGPVTVQDDRIERYTPSHP